MGEQEFMRAFLFFLGIALGLFWGLLWKQ